MKSLTKDVEFLVDSGTWEKLPWSGWHINKNGYVSCFGVPLHQVVAYLNNMIPAWGEVIDHKNRNRLDIEAINVSALEVFDNDAEVTVDALIEKGIIKDARDGVKILGNGELTKKLNVKVNAYSESAKAKIEELGGKAEVI